MTIEVDIKALVYEVLRAASENPDKSLPEERGGMYFYPGIGTPCCIVGKGLYSLGVRLEDLGTDNKTQVNRLPGIPRHALETIWLQSVQDRQDSGSTWAEAVLDATLRVGLPDVS